VGYRSTTAWGANIFQAASGTVEAVSFYAMAEGTGYEIRVYADVAPGNPVSGTLRAVKSGTVDHAGYYTKTLDEPISFSSSFSVAVKFATPGTGYPVPAEYPVFGYSQNAEASAGESFVSPDGGSWEPAYIDGVFFNVCIKAFGSRKETNSPANPTPQPAPPSPAPSISMRPLLGDYDGDGLGDAVLYQSSGVWNALLSRLGYGHLSAKFGGGAYSAESGDFDGDGIQDPALYDPSSGYWYFQGSRNGYLLSRLPRAWGAADCVPVSGDYDGDGKTDPIAYHEPTGYWHILSSLNDYETQWRKWWGAPGFSPLIADFDGDGYDDLIGYRKTHGEWYILLSSTGGRNYFLITGFGGGDYMPAAGDFDGDGYADLVIYHPSSHAWGILLSSTGWTSPISAVWDGGAR